MRGFCWLASFLVGCGAAAAPSVALAPTSSLCDGHDGLVVELPGPIAASWNGPLILGGTASATIRWCGAGTIVVERMTLAEPHGGITEYAFDPAATRLAHGEATERNIHGSAAPIAIPLSVFARDAAGTEIVAHAEVVSVLPPDFVAARDACLAQHGTFGPVGLAQSFACDRPTADAGRRCLSSAECEGSCLEDHVEVTTSPPDGRACSAGQEVRLHVGACAGHTLVFGCSPRLDEVMTECVVPGLASRHQLTCVD